MSVKDWIDDKNDPYVIANVDIVLAENGQEKIVVDFTGIALRLTTEKNEIVGKQKITTTAATSVPKNWKQLTKMTWHPLSPKPSFVAGQFAPREIQFLPFPNNPNDKDHTPGKFPLTWFNMAEFMSGHISRCLGEDFKKFDYSKTSRSPRTILLWSPEYFRTIPRRKRAFQSSTVPQMLGFSRTIQVKCRIVF